MHSFSSLLLFGVYATSTLGAAVRPPHHPPANIPHHPHNPFITQDELLPIYDYVVVGSGPGGGPLASRLARAGQKVLLIEAGDDRGDTDLYRVPGLQINVGEDPETRWSYFVNHYANQTQQIKDSKTAFAMGRHNYIVGQNSCRAKGVNPPMAGLLYPRAGTLGGCSSHNAMITTTPLRSDWDRIANITADSSWAADPMREHFVKIERNNYLDANTTTGHGFHGWLGTSLTDISMVLPDTSVLNVLTGAARALGANCSYPPPIQQFAPILAQDLNSADLSRDSTLGLFQVPMATQDGVRNGVRDFIVATATATLPGGSRAHHLDVLLNTLATRIVFNTLGATPRATGVEFMSGKSLYSADPRSQNVPGRLGSVCARNEVVISAGTFNTPQLLKLSGVGPKEELEFFGIDTIVDLPGVGQNMQDRYEVTISWETPEPLQIIQDCKFDRTGDACLAKWKNGSSADTRGIYHSNGAPLGIILKSTQAAESDEPDLFLFGGAVNFKGYYPGYSNDTTADSKHWTWGVLKTHSRNHAGTVKLRSPSPQDTPAITFNSFSGEDGNKDVKAVVQGLEFVRNMYSHLESGYGNFTEVWPGPEVTDLESHVRNEAWGHHACCTAKIGADGDDMAVLDGDFRVRRTSGLRVVDASVFPDIPNYFIATSIYMASEKAAEVLLKESQA